MDSTLLHSFVSIEPVSTTKHELHVPPGRAISRSRSAVSQRTDSNVELDRLGGAQGHLRNGRTSPVPRADLAGQGINNTADRDVEMSSQTSIEPPNTFDALPSLSSPPMNKYRLMSCCTTNLVLGLTDAAPGALIPYMETYYNIGYAVVSLIFIGQALGFIAAAPLVDTLRQALGRSRTIMLSQALLLLGYLPLVCLAPFPSVVVGYFFIGFGAAVPLAMNNVFCANLQNGTTMLGFMHGSYGIGGTAAPLVATALVTQANIPWGRYYLLPMALSVLNLILGSWSFRDYEKEQQAFNVEITEPLSQQGPAEVNTSGAGRTSSRMLVAGMFQAFRLRVALLGAFFIFAYQGAEVSISGWVISFLIATRNGDPSSIGYVTSGFWAGITIGRFVLSPLGARVGEKLFVYLLIAGAAVFQLLVWLVPNIIAESVSLAIVGLLLGPVYPCSTVVFARNLSSGQQVSGLSLISAFGTSGGAFAPFTTGLLAQAFGTFVLHPIAIGLFGVMAISWFGQPDSRKRDE